MSKSSKVPLKVIAFEGSKLEGRKAVVVESTILVDGDLSSSASIVTS